MLTGQLFWSWLFQEISDEIPKWIIGCSTCQRKSYRETMISIQQGYSSCLSSNNLNLLIKKGNSVQDHKTFSNLEWSWKPRDRLWFLPQNWSPSLAYRSWPSGNFIRRLKIKTDENKVCVDRYIIKHIWAHLQTIIFISIQHLSNISKKNLDVCPLP